MSELVKIEDVRTAAAEVIAGSLVGLMSHELMTIVAGELADKICAKLRTNQLPAEIIDNDGDRWVRNTRGTYDCAAALPEMRHLRERTYADVERRYGAPKVTA